jgi:hypothetical protein
MTLVRLKRIKTHSWAGLKNYDRCKTIICVNSDKVTGMLKTGLTEKEARELEEKLGYPVGHLNPNSEFWIDYKISIGTEDKIIDRSTPQGELEYKVLAARKIVAKDQGELRINPYAEFLMYDKEIEADESNRKRKKKVEAYKIYAELTPDEMRDILTAYGKKPEEMSPKIMEDLLGQEVELDPVKFVSIAKDDNFEFKVFINKCINNGILRKRGSMITIVNATDETEGKDVIGVDLEDTIRFIKDPKNNVLYLSLKKQLQTKLKKG